MTNIYDRQHKPFENAFAIKDPKVFKVLDSSFKLTDIIHDENLHINFVKKYVQWIHTTKNNSIIGLENYQYACFSNGTTEAFDKFYCKHNKKRFRFFKGEYLYHRLSCRNNNLNWAYIEDDTIRINDVVIISLPFSDTGNMHEQMESILQTCNIIDIPVLIDCAYFGVCSGIKFDFSHPCIKEITFSLSKSLYSAHLRIGMRLSKVDDDDPLFVTNKIGYVNRLSAHIGHQLIENFNPDYIYNEYVDRQEKICDILKVTPSNSVLFGIGGDSWNEYNRDRNTNRLSFHKFLHKSNLDEVKKIANEKR